MSYGQRVRLRPPLVDVLIAVVFVALVAGEAAFSPSVPSPVLHLAVAGSAMAALAWRRVVPLGVAAVVVASNLAVNQTGEFSTLLSLVLVCFTIGLECPPPRNWLGLAIVTVPFLVGSVIEGFEPSDLAAALVFFAGPWIAGVMVNNRIATTEAAVARVDQLERERVREAERAAAEERVRIARELHDIVSHSISVVTIQTQAVRRRLGPEHARESQDLAAVEATAREALAELRRLFGVLRAEGASPDLAPQPGLAELERLVTTVASGEVRVWLRVEGEPVPLSPGVDLAAYRIAQEGLTNALRHARATSVEVLVRYAPHQLEVEVADDGRGMNGHATGGHGLGGIRERVALYDGRMELGPSSDGGVRLAVTLPLGGHP